MLYSSADRRNHVSVSVRTVADVRESLVLNSEDKVNHTNSVTITALPLSSTTERQRRTRHDHLHMQTATSMISQGVGHRNQAVGRIRILRMIVPNVVPRPPALQLATWTCTLYMCSDGAQIRDLTLWV